MNIDKLKSKILQLAVQGKLVEQKSTDTDVEILLERISEEKERLIKEKKIKREKPLSEITDEEKKLDIPKQWKWCRSREMSTINNGKRVQAGYKLLDIPTEHIYIRVTDMKNGTILENDIKYISSEIYEKIKNYYIESDDIYITIAGTIGRVGVVPEKFNGANLTENASKIKCYYVKNEYIFRILNSDFLQKQIVDKTKKVGQPKLALNQIESLVLPLPPLEEQQRIVDKVDELFDIIDELTENKEEMIKNISDTRNKVLQLAIQGKLVEQCEDDEPVEILLERISESREKLIKEKEIKKEKLLPEINEEEKPFDIPKGWEWCRLNDICKLITDGTHSTPKYTDSGIPFISVKDITKGIIDFSDTRFISQEEHEVLIKRCNPEYGDVLLTKIGTTGIAKVVDTRKEFSIFVSIALLKLFNEFVNENYIEFLINSPFVKKQSEEGTQGVGNKNLVIRVIKNFIIPLPPLEEQQRIVAKVDEIMRYLDELEKTILEQDII